MGFYISIEISNAKSFFSTFKLLETKYFYIFSYYYFDIKYLCILENYLQILK
jgi:hypothetical protein